MYLFIKLKAFMLPNYI